MGRADLKALEDFIAHKKFLFGDAACNEDAAVFSFLVQIIYHDKGPFNEFLTSDFFIIIKKYILYLLALFSHIFYLFLKRIVRIF